MSTITSLGANDTGSTSRTTINDNFTNLNTDKLERSNLPSSSVDSEIALFSGTGGKTLKRASSTGILKATSGVIGVATSETDYTSPAVTKLTSLNIAPLYAPQGFLINGKISVTDTGSGLTVAIKTIAGTNPSSTDPVYVRIGDTVRTISTTLSVTKADGTNWCNAGSSELATKEIDYFVYLGYNATDGVVIGFSRIPSANQYSDFSTTTTNEKYCAISTITTAASTDYYEVVGRFAATLSAGAGYTWSVPTFTAANLIQRPIYETRWLTWIPTYTGFSSAPTTAQNYKLFGNTLYWSYSDAGTSNSATFNFTLPFTLALIVAGSQNQALKVSDNSANPTTVGLIGFNVGGVASSTVKIGINLSTAAANAYAGFTASGSKGADGQFFNKI